MMKSVAPYWDAEWDPLLKCFDSECKYDKDQIACLHLTRDISG